MTWLTDRELQRQRLRDQVEIIRSALPDVVAFTGDSDDLADVQYLYRGGWILVRDADLERVHRVLGGEGEALDRVRSASEQRGAPPINGLTRYLVPGGDTLAALDAIDSVLGTHVATPDHVLHLTPSTAGCCPATEPLPPGQDNPDPDVNRDPATSGAGVLVSVVDTGFLEELATSAKTAWLSGVAGDPESIDHDHLGPYVGHGTFVAGVVRCMAPQADVRVEGFLPAGGAIYESAIVSQLSDALSLMPDIISLSAGSWTRDNLPLLSFEVFWETRLKNYKGTVLVAAAGNDGNRGPFWPAAFPWTLSAGALDVDGQRAGYSNYGSWVDVYARGSDVVNAFPNGTYEYAEEPLKGDGTETATFDRSLARWSGTSFSTPIVSGLIAARMSRTGESARDAATALKALAVLRGRPGVGPVLEPGMASWPGSA